jgi:hypothetical protein
MGAGPSQRITRAVTPADLEGLLRSSRFASVAWAAGERATAEPAAFHYGDPGYRFGLRPGVFPGGVEVALVVDAGPWYFDLRGVRVRGVATRLAEHGEGGLEWFGVAPVREVAWHYGRMRDR